MNDHKIYRKYDIVYLLEDSGVVVFSDDTNVLVRFDNGTFGVYTRYGGLFEGDPVKLSFEPYTDPYTGITQNRKKAQQKVSDQSKILADLYKIKGVLLEGGLKVVYRDFIDKETLNEFQEIGELADKIQKKKEKIKESLPLGSLIGGRYIVKDIHFVKEGVVVEQYDILKNSTIKPMGSVEEFIEKFNVQVEYLK